MAYARFRLLLGNTRHITMNVCPRTPNPDTMRANGGIRRCVDQTGFDHRNRSLEGVAMSQQQESGEGSSGGGLGGGAIATIVGLAVLLVFVVQNRELVAFKFLVFSFSWPLWLYTIVVALFGALVWFGLGVMRRHRRRKARRADRRD